MLGIVLNLALDSHKEQPFFVVYGKNSHTLGYGAPVWGPMEIVKSPEGVVLEKSTKHGGHIPVSEVALRQQQLGFMVFARHIEK